jgi:hypothetical protein
LLASRVFFASKHDRVWSELISPLALVLRLIFGCVRRSAADSSDGAGVVDVRSRVYG